MTRKRSFLARVRSAEYAQARFLGNVRAVRQHRVKERVYNRIVGHFTAKLLRKVMK